VWRVGWSLVARGSCRNVAGGRPLSRGGNRGKKGIGLLDCWIVGLLAGDRVAVGREEEKKQDLPRMENKAAPTERVPNE